MNQSQVRLALSPSSQASSSNNDHLTSTGGAGSQVVSPELHEQLLLSVDHSNHDQHQLQHQHQQKKNLKTEYKSKFTPFDQYVYDEASDKFIKPPSSNFNSNSGSHSHSPAPSPRPHLHDLSSPTSDLASINSQAGDPWYREVVKRNEKANEYRFKSEVGHHSPLLGVPSNEHHHVSAGSCLSPSDHQPGDASGVGPGQPLTPTHLGEGGPRFTPSDYKRDHLIAHMANNNNFALPRDEAPPTSSGNARRTQQAARATAHARSRSQSSRRVPAAAPNTSTTAKQTATTSKSHQTTPTRTPRAPLASSRPAAAAAAASKTLTPTAKTTTSTTAPRTGRPATASASAAKRAPSASAARTTPRSLATTTTNISSPATKTTPSSTNSNSRTTASRAPARATPTTTHPRLPAGSSGGHRAVASKSTTSTSTTARAAGLAAGRLPSTSVKAPAKPATANASKASSNLASSNGSSRTNSIGASLGGGASEPKSGVKSIKTPALSQAKEVSAAEATMAVAAMGATGSVLGAIVQNSEAAQEEVAPSATVKVPEQQQQLEEEPTNLIFTTTEAGNMLADELAQAAQKEALELEEASQQQVEEEPREEVTEARVDEKRAPVVMLQVKRREVSLDDISTSENESSELINGLATGGLVSAEDRFDSSEREMSSLVTKNDPDESKVEEENEEPYSIMPRGEPVPNDFKGDEFHVELRSRHDLGHTWTEREDFERERETSPPSRDVSSLDDEEEDLTKVAFETEVPHDSTQVEQPIEVEQEKAEKLEQQETQFERQVTEKAVQPTEAYGQLMAMETKFDESDEFDSKPLEEMVDSSSSSPDSQLAAPQPEAAAVEAQVDATNDTNTDEMKHVMEDATERSIAEFSDQPSSPGDQTAVEPLAGDLGAMEQEQLHSDDVETVRNEEKQGEKMTTIEPAIADVDIEVEEVESAGEINGKEELASSPSAEFQEDAAGQQSAIETTKQPTTAGEEETSASETSTPTKEEVVVVEEGVQEKDLVREALIGSEGASAPLEGNDEAQNVQIGASEPETNKGLGSGDTNISSGSSESSSSSSSSDAEYGEEHESKMQEEEERSKSELLMNIVDLIDGEERRKQEMARKSEVARKSSSPVSPTMLLGEEVLLAPGQLIMEQFDLISGAGNNSNVAAAGTVEVARAQEDRPDSVEQQQQQQPNNDNNNTVEASDMREKELEKVTIESTGDLLQTAPPVPQQEFQAEAGVGGQKEETDDDEDDDDGLDSIGQDKGGSLSSLEGIPNGGQQARRQSDQLSSKATDDQQAELDQFGLSSEQQAIDLTEEEELKLSNRLTNSEDELILAPRNYNDNLDELAKAEQLDLLAREDRLDGQLELGDGSSAELEAAPSAAETLVEMASAKSSPELAMRRDPFGSSKQATPSSLMFATDDDEHLGDAATTLQSGGVLEQQQLLIFDNDDSGKITHDIMGPAGIQAAQEAPDVERASGVHNSS